MRARPGIRSQLSFVPQSPNGPAALNLAGPYYFQPDMRIFLDEEGSQRAERSRAAPFLRPPRAQICEADRPEHCQHRQGARRPHRA
jgi:hypothetical protein